MQTQKPLTLISLFSGIGAFEQALTNLNIPFDLIHYCEIDKHASLAYSAVHQVPETLNLGDITQVPIKKLPTGLDLLVFGSPCTSFSRAGKGDGAAKGSGTASSLLWNAVDIIEHCRPRYVIWENVSDVLSKRHREYFEDYLETMKQLGYHNFYQVMVAKDYGIPQNRQRLFVVSCLEEITFEFPSPIPLTQTALDFLDKEVDPKYYRDNHLPLVDGVYHIRQGTKKGYIELKAPGICDLSYPNSKIRRGRVQGEGKIVPTLTASKQSIMFVDEMGRLREMTPLERWRLMGFEDNAYYRAAHAGVSENQLYKQAGNSIVVTILEQLFQQLFLN